ncbi:Aminopeptidase 2 mitochondrial [Kappamyces sp. JEL0680]|nr:Aminopeptidase 2 mitochondrial [Kappamyces sp. JEL0680]
MCSNKEQKPRQILPKNVLPTNYNVTLVPGLETFKFTGQVSVSLTVVEATKTIVANAKELTISQASVVVFRVSPGGLERVSAWPKDPTTHRSTQPATAITYQPEAETVTLEFEHEIPATANVILHMEFQGTHNDQMDGFYRSSYVDSEGNKKYMVSTQFEVADARKALPCWDEPALKATFDVTLHIPQGLVGLSNMQVISSNPVEINGKTFTALKFATTPIMSTYLLAFCIGDFEYLEALAQPVAPADAQPVVVRTYTLRGQKELGRFANDTAVRVLEFFSQYFDVAYPLPKFDQIAIPDFAAGAMENWGLVTFREVVLLFDETKSSAGIKNGIAETVAHELAHQWFGNLVTMEWWDDLWLNEGFATFIGNLAVDTLFPEMDQFTNFIGTYFSGGVAMDALRSSHPIQVEVGTPDEVQEIFDAISYLKGASVIRMLESYIGREKFSAGVNLYLKRHSYSNTTTLDLWNALSEMSGLDALAMMHSWTAEVGYPVVSVEQEVYDAEKKELTLHLKQKRFLSSGDLTAEEEETCPTWFVPITVVTDLQPTAPTSHVLKTKQGTISFPYADTETAFWKLNAHVSGFYRVNYTPNQIGRIARALEDNIDVLSIKDRVGLVNDVFAIAASGQGSTTGALELLKAFKKEYSNVVLSAVATNIRKLGQTFFLNDAAAKGLEALTKSIFGPMVEQVGFEYSESDDFMTVERRTTIIEAAAFVNDEQVEKYRAGDSQALNANLFSAAFETLMRSTTSPEEDFEYLLKLAQSSSNQTEKSAALRSLGAINNLTLARKLLLEHAMNTDIIKTQDVPYVLLGMRSSYFKRETMALKWEWITENFELLYNKFGIQRAPLPHAIMGTIGEDAASQIEAWTNGDHIKDADLLAKHKKMMLGSVRAIANSLEAIRSATAWFRRDQDSVTEWLVLNNFAQ